MAPFLLESIEPEACIADKAYDTDAIVSQLEASNIEAVIPSSKRRSTARDYNKKLYKQRNWVERFFARLKHYRSIATRYEKTTESFRAMVLLACIRIWISPF